jgi:hypothetical protein
MPIRRCGFPQSCDWDYRFTLPLGATPAPTYKYINHITATDDIKKFGKGLGSVSAEYGCSWYAEM